MTFQPFTLSWRYSKTGSEPVVDEAGLSALSPKGPDFVRQLKASLKAQTLYSRGAMLTSLSLLAACGGGGGGGGGGVNPPPPANNAPVADADKTLDTNEDTAVTLDINAPTDADGDTLTLSAVVEPTNGDIVLNGTVVTDLSTLTEADLPNLTYQPDANFNGTDTFGYTVSDGNGGTDTQTITVNIAAVNDGPPVLQAVGPVATNEDTDVALGIPAPTDPDPEQVLTITAFTGPTNGVLVLNGTVVADVSTITVTDLPNLTYRPNADTNGADQISFTVSDGVDTTSQTITINVAAVNDDPVVGANADVVLTEDVREDLNFNGPTDVDGDALTITINQLPTDGTLFNGATAVADMDTLTVAEFEGLEFQPDPDLTLAIGELIYTVTDGNGGSAMQTIAFSITPVNDDPVAEANKTVTTNEDTDVALSIVGPTDVDNDVLTISSFTAPVGGVLVLGTTVVADVATITVADLPNLIFRPTADLNGEAAGVITYEISDGNGGTDSQTIQVNIIGQPDAPVVQADKTIDVAEDTTVGTPLNIDPPTDPDGDALNDVTIDFVPDAAEGVVRIAGGAALMVGQTITVADLANLEFVPAADFDGQTSFTYSVPDGTGESSTQIITFDLQGSNDAPVAEADRSASADVGGESNLNISAPADPDTGDTLTITVTAVPTEGFIVKAGETIAEALAVDDTLTVEELTNLRFVSEAGDSVGGAGTFAYDVQDVAGEMDDQTITLSLTSGTFDLTGGGGDAQGQGGALNGANGFEVTGVAGNIGSSVAGGGDFNGDNVSDIVVANPAGFSAFLIFGGATTVGGIYNPLTGNVAENGQNFTGFFGDSFGAALDLSDDINGDGIADLIIGAPQLTASGNVNTSEVFIVFGEAGNGTGSNRGLADGSSAGDIPDGTDGVRYISQIAGAEAGSGVAVIGDVDNDGFNDIAIGKPGAGTGGEITIIKGVDGSFVGGSNVVITPVLDGDDNPVLDNDGVPRVTATITDGGVVNAEIDDVVAGDIASSAASSDIIGLGDVNGDNIDDFLIGTPGAELSPGNISGEAFLIFGEDNLDLPSLSGDLGTAVAGGGGLRFVGQGGDQLGTVAGDGDFNGDGINDFIIGAQGADGNGTGEGAIAVFFGQADGSWSSFGAVFDAASDAATLSADDGIIISGVATGDAFGAEVASLGDFNGDGFDDFAVTATNADGGNGTVYIVFGRSDFSGGVDLSMLDSSSHIVLTGGATNLGQAISGAGDFNDDGLDDIIIGAEDTAYVLFGFEGDASGASSMSQSALALDNGILLPDENGDSTDLMPMDTAVNNAPGSQSSAIAAAEPLTAVDALIADDIDLSGLG